MQCILINDCSDANARGRLEARTVSLLGCPTTFIGIDDYSDIAASGILIDVLDAVGNEKAVVLVNTAPRHISKDRWQNGSPFGYFLYKNTTIITTVAGYSLSLVKSLRLTEQVEIFNDTAVLIDLFIKNELAQEESKDRLINTQFRSYEWLPRIALLFQKGIAIPTTRLPIEDIADMPHSIWAIDNFGNCKTTYLGDSISFTSEKLLTKWGEFKFYKFLHEVPKGNSALIVGSSGIGERRFVELVVQGQSAAKKYNIKIGDPLL